VSSAKRILADLRVFGRGYVRNGAALFFGVIFPVIIIALFGAIFAEGGSGQVTVYVQNKDTGPFAGPQMDIATQFVAALNGTLPNGTKIGGSWPLTVPQLVDPSRTLQNTLQNTPPLME